MHQILKVRATQRCVVSGHPHVVQECGACVLGCSDNGRSPADQSRREPQVAEGGVRDLSLVWWGCAPDSFAQGVRAGETP